GVPRRRAALDRPVPGQGRDEHRDAHRACRGRALPREGGAGDARVGRGAELRSAEGRRGREQLREGWGAAAARRRRRPAQVRHRGGQPVQAMTARRFPSAMAALIALTCVSSVARADTRSDADEHFRRGVDLYRDKDYATALVEFQRAYEIAPDIKTLYNIA